MEDKQWGMWQDVDWLPPGFAGSKGNLSRQRGHSLQHTPDCSLCIHTYTHTPPHSHKLACSRAGPFHLTALGGRAGICSPWRWHSVVLLEMELSPFNLPRCLGAGPHRASCAVTFVSYKQLRGEKQINPPTPHSTLIPGKVSSISLFRGIFVFLCTLNK